MSYRNQGKFRTGGILNFAVNLVLMFSIVFAFFYILFVVIH